MLFLGAGSLLGWLYDRPALGFLLAALLALLWQVRQLLFFDRALHTGDFDTFRYGDGIWQQMFSRFAYEHARGTRYKQLHRQVLREIRKSTDAMPDGAVVLDEANEISMCNRAAKSLVGLKRKKDRGQRVDNILRDPELTRLLRENDPTRTADIQSPLKDGDWLNCRVVPYGANQKLLLLRDVTERVAMNRMRRDFVANASHELRSPLTVISGYIDSIADDDKLPDEWIQPISQMRVQARRMAQLVSDLMELSRLEGAGRAGTDETVDVAGLLAAGQKAFCNRADAPKIQLHADSQSRLQGNTREIESVITNLLSNAIRHTPADGTITLAWQADLDGAELVVTDSGEGIDAEYIPRLTERFFRVDRGRAREDGGIGLGLAIVKHVLSRHDAELKIVSEPGSGSTFCCRFPSNRVIPPPLS